MKKIKRSCSKRPIAIEDLDGYCDWFDKKTKAVLKRCCNNCRYLRNDEETEKKAESSPKKTKRKPKEPE